MAPDEQHGPAIAAAVSEISERASLLVREEIALAKAEVQASVKKLLRAAVVGIVAGVFVVVGLLYLLQAAAWGVWRAIDFPGSNFWLGFLIVAIILFLLAGGAGFLAFRFVKTGTPPTPVMAIDEAKKIRATVSGKRASVTDHAAAGTPTRTPAPGAPAGPAESVGTETAGAPGGGGAGVS